MTAMISATIAIMLEAVKTDSLAFLVFCLTVTNICGERADFFDLFNFAGVGWGFFREETPWGFVTMLVLDAPTVACRVGGAVVDMLHEVTKPSLICNIRVVTELSHE